jgi:transcriptional regulator with XRE-family HTH domain
MEGSMERRQLHWSLEERIRFGSRFRTRRSERGLDALDLVSAFNLHQKKLSGYLQSLIHPLTEENGRSRISRLENGKLGSIFEDELQLWALTVEWSVEEWLERVPPRGFEWEPDQLAAFGRVLAKHEEDAQHLTGWAGFLPCSLETEEFMQLHNRYLCEHVNSYTPAVKFHGNLDAAVRYYNEFGTRRRTRLH